MAIAANMLAGDDPWLPRLWRSVGRLSSGAMARIERFLDQAGFDRAPWLAVGLATGIAAWFDLGNRWQWLALVALCLAVALLAWVAMRRDGAYPYIQQAVFSLGLCVAAGCLTVWAKSSFTGTPPIMHAMAPTLAAKVLDREDIPAQHRFRLTLALRDPHGGRAIRVRVNVPEKFDAPGLTEGSIIRLRARLMPPRPPQLPGARDFARDAWFSGLAASGSAMGPIIVVRPALGENGWARLRHALSDHVRSKVPGSPGGIAATLVSGTRGGIAWDDQQAMRDAGLTHLLAISGLHVSAVVAGAYLLTFRLLAMWPWLVLRLRLPVVATAMAAGAGIGYTLLTGMHLPTVRACSGALLVLVAMALGRQPLSMRLLASAACIVMLMWPEEVVGPSFQLSFGSVVAIIALHGARPVQLFLAHREEGWWRRLGRHTVMLLLTGLVIDLALMPIALHHFHRAGIFGSLANLIAIPLVTFVTMPFIALGLVLDLAGLGAPAWWVVNRSLTFLLAVTHGLVSQPGAVSLLPTMGGASFVLFVGGMLWLGLWHGWVRLLGLVPVLLGALSLAMLRAPDVLITGDGRNLGIADLAAQRLLILRPGRTSFSRDMMIEQTGMTGQVVALEQWPGAQCNKVACRIVINRGGRIWHILVIKTKLFLDDRSLASACAEADIVVAQTKLYGPCHPSMLKADREMLLRSGGLALDLERRKVISVEDSEGEHPWWRAPHRLPKYHEEEVVIPYLPKGGG